MRYEQLEHLIRAARDVINEPFVYVVGSQSILPWLKKREGVPPRTYNAILKLSMEADIIPGSGSERFADLIDGSLGEESMFDETFGYYAQGVGFETPKAPKDWTSRCLPIIERGKTIAYCMHPTDLFIAKSVAAREKDGPFLDAMIHENLVHRSKVLHLMPKMYGVISENAIPLLEQSICSRFDRIRPGDAPAEKPVKFARAKDTPASAQQRLFGRHDAGGPARPEPK
jgi:hypothetical protein